MKRLGIVAGVLLVLALVGYSMRATIAQRIMRNAISGMMAADPLAELADGIHVTLCGAGSPLPDPKRSGPCVGVVAGGTLFVVDAGSSAARNMGRGLPPGETAAVFLTHFHSDHIDGLGELQLQRWAGGNPTAKLPVYGPPGVEKIVDGLNLAYELDVGYRIAHHGAETMNPAASGLVARPFAAPTPGNAVVVWDEGGVEVTAFRVEHPPIDPAVGYRFDYAGRSVVITGDTNKSAEIARMSKEVDLLVHEALAPHLVQIMKEGAEQANQPKRAKIMGDILDYHASPVDAAETAQESGARHLLFYHVVPPLILPGMEAAFLQGVDDAYSGPVTLGEDGVTVSLPANSDAIEVSGG
jgi:ribonuclease Z